MRRFRRLLHLPAGCVFFSVGDIFIYGAFKEPGVDVYKRQELGRAVSEAMGSIFQAALTRKGNNGNWDYNTVIKSAVDGGVPMAFLLEHGYHTNYEAVSYTHLNYIASSGGGGGKNKGY